MTGEELLAVEGVTKHYPIRRGQIIKRSAGVLKAVDGVSFELRAGETLGIVGESGCGKSTLAKLLIRLEQPTGGHIRYRGTDIAALRGRELRDLRRQVQVVFQDPYSSLDPRMTVGQIIAEPFAVHRGLAPTNRRRRVRELLKTVGLNPEHIDRYPHQFSGGQRQRIGIARALALRPDVLVCDEPVSALDVSIQAQIINLLRQLQRDLGLAYVFIAHDLAVVRHISHRVAVMYLGKIVEIGTAPEIFEQPAHPYTRALLSAAPVPDPHHRGERIILRGDPPSPVKSLSGCSFRPRCWQAVDACAEHPPALIERGTGHPVACIQQPTTGVRTFGD
ncbi:dipeptide ABC transporter ATP-binding protein [Streptosporangium sp. NPDC001681]|uniref:ABC transporter ATP-binding protein n=1 Tax=Streptosporangium sp. NPDC001681 TaxID=3154395 RepID=UPI00331D59AD